MTFGPLTRKAVLSLHITVSVGWIGAVLSYLVFDVMSATSGDEARLRLAYAAMHDIATWAILPLALAALGSGVLMALGSKWGLFRHWWVLISLVLTSLAVGVLLIEMQTIDALAAIAADPTTGPDEVRALPSTLVHSVGGLVLLVVVQVLNVVKPRGLTRYGWRKQQAEPQDHGARLS